MSIARGQYSSSNQQMYLSQARPTSGKGSSQLNAASTNNLLPMNHRLINDVTNASPSIHANNIKVQGQNNRRKEKSRLISL